MFLLLLFLFGEVFTNKHHHCTVQQKHSSQETFTGQRQLTCTWILLDALADALAEGAYRTKLGTVIKVDKGHLGLRYHMWPQFITVY